MTKNNEAVCFYENAVYTADQVADIIHRHPKTVRDLCRRGIIRARLDRGGYVITGWAIRDYAENRVCVSEK